MDDAGGMCAVGAVWQVHIDGRCTPAEATAAVNVLDDFAVTCGYEWDEADDHPAFNYNDAEAQCMDHIVVFMRVAAFAAESKPTELAVAA